MSELIEPSNADLGDAPDSVREYLQALEAQNGALTAAVALFRGVVGRGAIAQDENQQAIWAICPSEAAMAMRANPNEDLEVFKCIDEWLCTNCQRVFPFQSISPWSQIRCKKCNSIMRPSSQALREAQDRVFDLLLGDDGQASKEAERYLERSRPDLHERLQRGSSNG